MLDVTKELKLRHVILGIRVTQSARGGDEKIATNSYMDGKIGVAI